MANCFRVSQGSANELKCGVVGDRRVDQLLNYKILNIVRSDYLSRLCKELSELIV